MVLLRFFQAMVLLHIVQPDEREYFLTEVMEGAKCFEVPWEPSSDHGEQLTLSMLLKCTQEYFAHQ